MSYQKKQEELYKAAMRKRREAIKMRLPKNFNRNHEEQEEINYFQGIGIYAQHQDSETKPNIFDTRQSFLRKMYDPILRRNFLNS